MPAEAAISSSAKPKKSAKERTDLRDKGTYTPDVHRMLPQSQDAELGLLGSVLLSPREVMTECVEQKISPEHFHAPANGIISPGLMSSNCAADRDTASPKF